MIFSASAARRQFEIATGARLIRHRTGFSYWLFRQRHPLGRTLPRVERFDGTAVDVARFGGQFSLRVRHEDTPDLGVEDGGFGYNEIERGPQAGELTLSAAARRANVTVAFWPDTAEPTNEAQQVWRKLTEFLHRL